MYVCFALVVFLLGSVQYSRAQNATVINPGETIRVPRGTLKIRLDHAEVDLTRTDLDHSELRFRERDDASTADVTIVLRRTAGNVFILQRPDSTGEQEDRNIHIVLELSQDQKIGIEGDDLSVSASFSSEETGQEEDDENQQEEAPGGADMLPEVPFRLEITRSVVRILGISSDFEILSQDSSVRIIEARGNGIVECRAGTLDIIHPAQSMMMTADGTTISMEGGRDTTIDLHNGRLSAEKMKGRFTCSAEDSSVVFFQAEGHVDLSGTGSNFNFNQAHFQRLDVEGEGQTLFLDGEGGLVHLDCSRATIEVPRWKGRVEVGLKESSSFDLAALDGDLLFSVDGNSEFKLKNVTGHVRGRAGDSHLVFKKLKSMEVQIRDCRLDVIDLREITILESSRSEIDISAPNLKGTPKISLLEDSSLELELPSPCIIELEQGPDDWSSVIDAPNCGVRINGRLSGNLAGANRKGPRPIKTKLIIDDSSYIRADVPL